MHSQGLTESTTLEYLKVETAFLTRSILQPTKLLSSPRCRTGRWILLSRLSAGARLRDRCHTRQGRSPNRVSKDHCEYRRGSCCSLPNCILSNVSKALPQPGGPLLKAGRNRMAVPDTGREITRQNRCLSDHQPLWQLVHGSRRDHVACD